MMGTWQRSERTALGIMSLFALGLCVLSDACRQTQEEPSGSASSADLAGPAARGRSIRASSSTELAPLAVGQWVRYGIRYTDGRRSQLTYKVVDREQNALWVELVTGVPNAGTVLELLIGPGSRATLDGRRIEAARISMPNGAVRELRGAMLEPSRPGYSKALSPLFSVPFAHAPQETVKTAAGSFAGCHRLERDLVFGELDGTFTVWMHPSVPVTGLLRATAKSGEATIELDGFGTHGAHSSMKRRG
jgi:hypothetical protein